MSSGAMSVEAAETVKAGQRAMWDAGDHPDIAQTIEGCAAALGRKAAGYQGLSPEIHPAATARARRRGIVEG